MGIAYRREVDGLRALAVLPVILFHAGLPAFQGGFVGVDVFFVISGYLITSILIAEHAAGRFSMVEFWERRARRILPALFLVMFVCLPFAWLWLFPRDLAAFGESLIGVSVYSSNLLFWKTSGYFAPAAELNPLLHTWSLAVEEQYYLLFPPFLMLAWRWGRGVVVALLAAGAAFSLYVAHRWITSDPSGAYYLLPARGWELGIGALLAFHLADPARRVLARGWAEAGAALGLALLAYAVVAFDERTPFPGLPALVPTVGTALLIACATEHTLLGRCLGWRPLVAVGLISYSAYLWHQPLFAFARHASVAEPSAGLMAALALAALGLAAFSWRYVEAPYRDRHRFTRRQVFTQAAVASLFFIGVGLVLVKGEGFATRLSTTERAVVAYQQYNYSAVQRSFRCQLMQDQRAGDFAASCGLPDGSVGQGLVVWGDSHAAALSYGLRESPALRARYGTVAQWTAASCPPMPGVRAVKSHCEEINRHILEQVRRQQPRAVVLHAAWSHYRESADVARFGAWVAQLRQLAPATRVLVLGSVPTWPPTLPQFLVKSGLGLDAEARRSPPQWAELRAVDASLERVVRNAGAEFVSVLDALCPDGQCPVVVRDGKRFAPTAWDGSHLTAAGSHLLAARLTNTLEYGPVTPTRLP